jgi:tryptophan 2,3-dioxygenase
MAQKPTTYWEYLRLEELLELQGGKERDESALVNDEVLFIVIHQIDELWFKLALRELVSVRDLFHQNPVPEQSLASAVRGLRRLAMLFSQVSTHFALMETMTTRDYLGFRDKLSPASGFQSAQLREVEILFGLSDEERVPLGSEKSYLEALKYPDGRESHASRRVAARMEDTPSLHSVIQEWLHRTPIQGSKPEDPSDDEAVASFVEAFLEAHRAEVSAIIDATLLGNTSAEDRALLEKRYDAQMKSAAAFMRATDIEDGEERRRVRRIRAAATFIESYRELPLLAWPREVIDSVVALEQAFLMFRQRHARMVERVIGRRTGTGGSTGVDYLDSTALRYRVFRDVWAVRTILLRQGALPPLEKAESYGFVAGG